MHVRYLQHSTHGTVQLLMMPMMSAAAVGDSFRDSKGGGSEEEFESEPVPLPIQSFLWRQTNPFLGARVSKLQDASCVTFERVIVQNILHGISPSLSDAIASISRWNLVRASFPHIIQCCAALLTERAGEEEGLAMSSSLVKILYILHWLLIDAAVECNENSLNSENNMGTTAGALSVRQLTYSVASIQLFVYLLAPLFNVVREEEIEGHIRLENGLRLWQNLWQQKLPELLCFSAPVKQKKNQLPQLNSTPWAKRVQSTAAEQGIYVGEKVATTGVLPSVTTIRRASQTPAPFPSCTSQENGKTIPMTIIPPPKPPRTDVNVLRELEMKKHVDGNEQRQQQQLGPTNSGSGIVRSVSDYKSATIAEQSRAQLSMLRKSKTTGFQSISSPDSPADDFSSCSGIKCMEEMFDREEEDGFSAFEPSLKSLNGQQSGEAPLVQLKDICSIGSIDTWSSISTISEQQQGENVVPKEQGTPMASMPSTRQIPKTLVCSPSGEDTASLSSQQTVINVRPPTTMPPSFLPPPPPQPTVRPPQILFTQRSDSELSADKEKADTPPMAASDPHVANYMDIAVFRCLLIRNWAEEGVFWAVRYLLNRLMAIRQYRCHEGAFRSRCNSDSAAIPARKTSKNEVATLDSQGYLTWADLQARLDGKNGNIGRKLTAERQQQIILNEQNELDERKGVAFDVETQNRKKGLNVPDKFEERRRRISVNTLPSKPIKKASKTDANLFRGIHLCRSEPTLLPRLAELLLSFTSEPSSSSGPTTTNQQEAACRKASQFFPEAIGSSTFIDRNGQIGLPIVLKVLGTLMERCSIVRVSEVVLNICDTLLNMPGIDQSNLFSGLLHIVHRICLQLGCPNGCNEGIRTPQAEFLRVKLRNLMAQMHRINSKRLSALLREQVANIGIGQMVDGLHALTVFCQINPALSRNQQQQSSSRFSQKPSRQSKQSIRRSSPSFRNPTYKNNFNESKSGIEGVLISTMFGSLLTKLAKNVAELGQPENMSLAQDVRLLVSYVYEKHGNPLRRCALSAMAVKTLSRSSISMPQANVKNVPTNPILALPQREVAASLRRGLFRKKEWMQTTLTNEQTGDSDGPGQGGSNSNHSTPPPKLITSASVDDSIGSPQQLLPVKKGKVSGSSKSGGGGGRLQFALSLLKGTRPSGIGSEQVAANSEEDEGSSNPADDQQEEDGSLGGSSTDAGNGKGKYQGGVLRGAPMPSRLATPRSQFGGGGPAAEVDDRTETASPNLPKFLPPRKLVQIKEIREGAARFAFLMEHSRPTNFPDAPLVGAIAELKSPVVSRAVTLLECINFVQRCNRGDWPDWIRSGMSFPGGRTFGNSLIGQQTPIHPQNSIRIGGGGAGGGGGGGASRRTALLQRALGRAFYGWATQLGIRLQRQIDLDEKGGMDRKQLKLFDELEDFLDDGTVNAKCDAFPVALQLMVCALLHQITAFLRETFQTLPRSRQHSQKTTGAASTGWERLQSHRRWSILSNTFNPQMQQIAQQQQPLATGSIHSINELHPERRVSYSTADEENSPRGSHDLINEDQQPLAGGILDKTGKVRRLAQGRQRLLKRNSPSAAASGGGTFPTPPSSADPIGGLHNRSFRESIRIRKISKPTGSATSSVPAAQNDMDNLEATGESSALPSESVPLMRRATHVAPTEPTPQRVVSFVQRRRRTTSFKTRVSRSLIPRHSMRGRMSVDQQDLVTGIDDEPDGQKQPMMPTPTLASQGSPCSPIFMLSIAKQANPGSRLRPNFEQQSMPSPERLSSSTGNSFQQFQFEQQTDEEDEEEMLRNMPWLKTLMEFSQKFEFNCRHEHFCTKWCFERIYRQSHRLLEALLVIYEQISPEKRVDRRQQFIKRWQNSQNEAKKRHSSNPPRRESANIRQSGVERMPLALRGLIIEKLSEIEENRGKKAEEGDNITIEAKELRAPRPLAIVNVLRVYLLDLVHSPLSGLLKGIVLMKNEQLIPAISIAWALLNRIDDANLTATAAALFICCAVKCPQECTVLVNAELLSPNPTVRTEAIRRFYILWRQRFHVWLKMEEGAQLIFKVPPPSIDFTLPSPSIGQSQMPIVDPPWMPPVKTKVEELSLKEEEQSTSQTIMTMTRTRRKQKQEMVRKAVKKAEERQRELREQFPMRATAVVQQAAYEPALFQHQLMADGAQGGEDSVMSEPIARQMIIPVAQPLFPSSLLSVVPSIVELLDDPQVDNNGMTVSETCRNVIWNCLVEDSALFLRHFFEKFTNRGKQEQMIALLRRLVLTFRPLPSQSAHTICNALLGLVMFYVRTPGEGTDRSLALALSLCWLVIPFVQGLYFKDLKQTLKKEQCDQAIMITANVPSAKKVIVHGPDSHQGGIPTQFPVLEDTLFQHLLADSIEFYNIDQAEAENYFLYDPKTFVLHNPSAYVRDFYFFHRSFYPQLQLVHLDPQLAQQRIREHAFQQKIIETGKVLLTHNALRYSPEAVVPQRIFFLHDEFTHLPSFPRRAVESCFGMYQGKGGDELQTMDSLHKFAWSKLMGNMFEKMENVFMFGDLHLFINVINGVMIIHCEDVLILRRCMAAYLSMSIHFQSLFASQGFFLIMPTILRCYSQRQPNRLFTQVVEFVCKQFYILHRKPFLLQMFGSIADILDQNDCDLEASPMRVKAKYLFALLLAMERTMEPLDQLDILSLLPYSKPLQALDLCYRDEPNTFTILTDAMAICVTICAFAPESRRSHQMLLCIQSMIPHLLQFMEEETQNQSNCMAALKHEMNAFCTLSVEMRALVNSCDILARGPTRSFDFLPVGSTAAAAAVHEYSCRGRSFLGTERADSPQFFDPPTIVDDDPSRQQPTGQSHSSAGAGNRTVEKKITSTGWADGTAAADIEFQKEQFRGPRDALLTLCSFFIRCGSIRLKELAKLAANFDYNRMPELLDHKCHVKLLEIAVSLLKLAPYDANTLACLGLRQYFSHILPIVDWSVETNRSAINVILRRLDKTIAKIAKRPSTRRRANWNAVSCWLAGLHQTLVHSPYIAHLHSLKTITLLCLRLSLGDTLGSSEEPTGHQQPHISTPAIPHTVLNAHIPPPSFCSIVLKLASFLMSSLGQSAFSLELICTSDCLGPLAERPEALLCQFLIPMFLRVAISAKESPQFQAKDLNFCLILLQNWICPPLAAKQSVVPAVSGNSLATSLIRDTAGRQGSVSVTDKGGYSATVSTTRIVRDSVVLTVMLALKTIAVSFQKQLNVVHWLRIARIVREMIAKKCGSPTLGPFLKFMMDSNLPISEMLHPIVQSKLNQKPANEMDSAWQVEMREKLSKVKSGDVGMATQNEPFRKGIFSQLRVFHRELQMLKEDFVNRNLEIPRSHTPTIGGELHSDSGSLQGTGIRDSRRLSSSTALGKLRWIQSRGGAEREEGRGKCSLQTQQTLQDNTIPEDTAAEEENVTNASSSAVGLSSSRGVVNKSPSLPFSSIRSSIRHHQNVGMFRSMRKKTAKLGDAETGGMAEGEDEKTEGQQKSGEEKGRSVELKEVRRSRSLKRYNAPRPSEDEGGQHSLDIITEPSTPSQSSSLVFGERPRVVSFSTPRHSSISQTISEADSKAEFAITSIKHLI